MAAKPRTLKPVRPSLGLEAAYRQRLDRLIEAMHKSLLYWLSAQWRQEPPVMAEDRLPAAAMRQEMRSLARRWQRQFNDAAPKLAEYFATAASDRSTNALQRILDEAGMTVKFRMTDAARDVYQAVIGENVGLIKSIAQQHLVQVEGIVMRSVAGGRKLDELAKELQEQFGVTKRRAALIARDQNNKATAVLTRVRQRELGVQTAIWMHSGGGKHPRPSHVAFNGKTYDIDKGAYIDGEWIFPGQLINCRCVSRSVIPGFNG